MCVSFLAMLAVKIKMQHRMLNVFVKNVLKRGSCDESNEVIIYRMGT